MAPSLKQVAELEWFLFNKIQYECYFIIDHSLS
jgi:hypothetical protein